jgi:hypothetical protein
VSYPKDEEKRDVTLRHSYVTLRLSKGEGKTQYHPRHVTLRYCVTLRLSKGEVPGVESTTTL